MVKELKNTIKRKPIYSAIAIHPGEILKDEIESRNLVKSQFAKDLGILPGHLSELFKGKRHVSASLALILQDHLEISAETWMNLQVRHDLSVARALKNNTTNIIQIIKAAVSK